MRTTLDIDEDVFQAARELARRRRLSTGKVLSELARKALVPPDTGARTRNGVPLLPRRPGARPVTLEDVKRLQDEEA